MVHLAPALARRGAAVVIVGSGKPEQARAFAEAHASGIEVYTDPSRASYDAAGFTSSALATFSPRAAARAVGALLAGHRQSSTQGSAFQQGGVLILGPGDTLHARYVSRSGGDHPTDAWLEQQVSQAGDGHAQPDGDEPARRPQPTSSV